MEQFKIGDIISNSDKSIKEICNTTNINKRMITNIINNESYKYYECMPIDLNVITHDDNTVSFAITEIGKKFNERCDITDKYFNLLLP